MNNLIERIQENRLDALYLFINESLRDRTIFDTFLRQLIHILPMNWSIQRVEIGHEFLSMLNTTVPGGPNNNNQNNNGNDDQGQQVQVQVQQQQRRELQQQQDLMEVICSLESLKTLIISDGYVPRKDNGSIPTHALLEALPLAKNLCNLDIQRLGLRIPSSTLPPPSTTTTTTKKHKKKKKKKNQVLHLANVFEQLHESLEDIRLTGLFVIQDENDDIENDVDEEEDVDDDVDDATTMNQGILDPVIEACVNMTNLKSLAISLKQTVIVDTTTTTTTTTQQHQQQQQQQQQQGNDAVIVPQRRRGQQQQQQHGGGGGIGQVVVRVGGNGNDVPSSSSSASASSSLFLSKTWLQELCQTSTTLQDLSLRGMQLTNDTCWTIASALKEQSCFLTSLDIRQNPNITSYGYQVILHALERNCNLWCTVMVDNDEFQGKFNTLIELNQAGRGNLIQRPSGEKLIHFLTNLQQHQQSPTTTSTSTSITTTTNTNNINDNHDPTSIWYFLSIHDSILYPLVNFLSWKEQLLTKRKKCQQQQQRQQQQDGKVTSSTSSELGKKQATTTTTTTMPFVESQVKSLSSLSSLLNQSLTASATTITTTTMPTSTFTSTSLLEQPYDDDELQKAIAAATTTTTKNGSSSSSRRSNKRDRTELSYDDDELQKAIATANRRFQG